MKIKLFAFALVLLPAAVLARDIDVSNSPNSSFFLGYNKDYENGCRVHVWWNLRDKYTLTAYDKCQGISDKQLYDDMVTSMREIKSKSNAPNFARYAEEKTEERRLSANSPYNQSPPSYTEPSPGYPIQFCVDNNRDLYFFADIPRYANPGWNIAYRDIGGKGEFEEMGLWQVAIHGEIILTSGPKSTAINSAGTRPCGYSRRR